MHLEIVFLLVLLCAAPALALTPAELVTPQLEAQPVSLSSIRGDTISYFDAGRNLRRESISAFVQVRAIGGRRVERSPQHAMLVLTDGQRLAGQWLGAADEGQAIRWRHGALGEFVVPLDRVARLEFAGPSPPVDAAADDRVVLHNGDALNGFIAEVADDALRLTLDGAADPVELPLQRVAAVTFANPTRPADATQHRVTLDDGSQVAALELEVAGDACLLLPALASDRADPITLPIAGLVRIDFTGAGYELLDLSALPMRIVESADVFGLTIHPRVEGGRVHAHAPSRIAFDLPSGVRHLAATAALDVEPTTPPQRVGWAAFELVVRVDGEEAGRFPVDGERRRTAVNVPIGRGAAELTLELDAAVNGPIMDRLRLEDATLLRDRPEPSAAVQTE